MELNNIDQITDEGLVVFMPSGIQATLRKDGENIIVEYPEMYCDTYTPEKFNELIKEGIFIFNEPTIIMEGYSQQDAPVGTVYKAMKDKKKEFVTPEFKNEILTSLDKIARQFPDVEIRQQALTFMDELGLQEYYDIALVKTFVDKNLKQMEKGTKELEENLKEELGPMANNVYLQEISKQLDAGNKQGYEPESFGNWLCETSLDMGWEKLTDNTKKFILEKIALPVYDGHIGYEDLEIVISQASDLTKEDLQSLDLLTDEDIDNILNDEKFEFEFHLTYEIQYDNNTNHVGESFKVKKRKRKKLDELSIKENLYLVGEDGQEEGPFKDQQALNDFIDLQRKHGNKTEYEEVIKENKEDKEVLDLNTNLKQYYLNTFKTDELGKDLNGDITVEDVMNCLKDKKDIYELLKVNDSLVRERVFDILNRLDNKTDWYGLWLKAGEEKYGLDKDLQKLTKMVNEELYNVYDLQNPDAEAEKFHSWNEVDEYLNKQWGQYQASMAKENNEFGTDADKEDYMGNFDVTIQTIEVPVEEIPAEGIELPVVAVEPEEVEEPAEETEEDVAKDLEQEKQETEMEMKTVEAPETKQEVKEIEQEIKDEIKNQDELKEDVENVEDEEKIETPQQAKDEIEEIEDKIDNLEDYIKTLLDAEDDDDEEPEIDNQIEIEDEILDAEDNLEAEPQQEAFEDKMGMMTDVKDLDLPDALASTVDTTDDGTIYKLSDLAKELNDLKNTLKVEIEAIKTDIKTALQDVKQDIKVEVNDVENQVQDTKNAVDDLTVEEEETEEIEQPEETQEPAEETETEETEVETEETVEESYTDKNLAGDPIYEAIKQVKNNSTEKYMSVPTIAERIREDFGINTKDGIIYNTVKEIISKTSLKENIVDIETEKKLIKESRLGKAAKWLSGGLMAKLRSTKKDEDLNSLKAEIDKLAREKKDAEVIKNTITMKADNDDEAKKAQDYAISKLSEEKVSNLKESLLKTSSTSKLNQLRFQ